MKKFHRLPPQWSQGSEGARSKKPIMSGPSTMRPLQSGRGTGRPVPSTRSGGKRSRTGGKNPKGGMGQTRKTGRTIGESNNTPPNDRDGPSNHRTVCNTGRGKVKASSPDEVRREIGRKEEKPEREATGRDEEGNRGERGKRRAGQRGRSSRGGHGAKGVGRNAKETRERPGAGIRVASGHARRT
nr:hypothetical protein Iba_chr04aCG14300 [Ipomoea batatas]